MSGLPGDVGEPPTHTGGLIAALGALAAIFGVFFVATGISGTIEEASGIREDAVATGVAGESIAIEGADEKQTAYLDLGGVGNSLRRESIVAATTCEATAENFRDRFTGAVQGVSTSIGDLSSVGTFTLPEGSGQLVCITTTGARSFPLIVSPRGGGAVFAAVLKVVGGVVLAGLGFSLLVIGALRRRRARRAAPPPAGPPR